MVKKSIENPLKNRIKTVLLQPVHLFRRICYYTGAFVLTLLGIVIVTASLYFYTLPPIDAMSYEALQKAAQAHVKQQLKTAKKGPRWVKLKNINRDYLYTVVMAEDANFFTHHGINYDALLHSMVENIKKQEFAYGASTITQQVAKNIFLTKEKSLFRKLREYSITKRLESRFTKNQILEVYLNIVELGYDTYGVDAGARRYFGKPSAQINAAEGALIALLLPSPRRYAYSIFQNAHLSPSNKRKYIRILKDMRYHEFISPEQYNHYLDYTQFLTGKQ